MTSKERAYLIKLSHDLTANCQIGKAGLAAENITQVDGMLRNTELIKLNVMRSLDCDIRELAEEIAAAVQAQVVIALGRKIVLYRHSAELAKKGKSISFK